MGTLVLGQKPLTLEDVREVAVNGKQVSLSNEAIQKIKAAHRFLLSKVKSGETFYGVNTGFGLLSNVKIPPQEIETLQYNLLRSHACGIGPALADGYVRAMLLLRASNLSIGHSGVSLQLVEHILNVLNAGIIPVIPEQGSVGASGDLAPLAHLALVLIGEGVVHYQGRKMEGGEALQLAGLKPIRLGPKEGLALINGTQFMTALGSIDLLEAEHLSNVADMTGAMSLEALKGTITAFEPEIHAVRPHPGQIQVAANLKKILLSNGSTDTDGSPSEIAQSHADCEQVQDPYSLRCMPQVHGSSRDVLTYVRQVLEREINSVTDNPLVFPEQGKILSGGNFHGQTIALAMDFMAIAMAELGSISEQRLAKLVNPAMSGLPPFLTTQGGLNSGFMMVHVAASSIVSENKTLCHPASVDSIPTSADKEDHVSMGAWAARKAGRVLTNVRRILVFELLGAAQGIDLLRPLKSSDTIEKMHSLIRKRVSRLDQDRAFYKDYGPIEELIGSVEFQELFQNSVRNDDPKR